MKEDVRMRSFFFFAHEILVQFPKPDPFRSTASIAFSNYGMLRKHILKAIGAAERKGSGKRD